jgi:hypothetical protein
MLIVHMAMIVLMITTMGVIMTGIGGVGTVLMRAAVMMIEAVMIVVLCRGMDHGRRQLRPGAVMG